MDNTKRHLQLVFLGPALPKYFIPSIKLLNRYNNLQIELLGDADLYKSLPRGLATFVPLADFYDESAFAAARANLAAPIGFRNGFWQHALERFFVLSQFASYAGRRQIFHAEGDQLLVGGERLLAALETSGRRGLFFPMHTSESGLASVFFVNNLDALAGLLAFSEETSPFSNEMELLAAWGAKYQSDFHRLPTLADLLNGPNGGARAITLREPGHRNHPALVVDAAQVGQWVAGIDPRNIPHNQKAHNHFCDPPKGNLLRKEQLDAISVRLDEELQTLLVFQDSELIGEIFNLHLHSKIHASLAVSSKRIQKLLSIAGNSTRSIVSPLSRELTRIRVAEKVTKAKLLLEKRRDRFENTGNRLLAATFRTVGYRPSSFPFISGDSFRAVADFVWEERVSSGWRKRASRARVFFCEGNRLEDFCDLVLPHVRPGATLILGNSDRNFAPGDLAAIEPSSFQKIFVQNLLEPYDGALPLPIGLENAWRRNHGTVRAFTRHRQESAQRNGRIMWSFDVATNPAVRQDAEQSLQLVRFADKLKRASPPSHRQALRRYSFVACPPGNGLDTHRVWEALYLGCIPIVPRSYISDYFAGLGLPLFVVDSFRDLAELTAMELGQIEAELTPKFCHPGIWIRFWLDKIMSADD